MNKTQLNGLVELAKKKIDKRISDRKNEIGKNVNLALVSPGLYALADNYIQYSERLKDDSDNVQKLATQLAHAGAKVHFYTKESPTILDVLTPCIFKQDTEIQRLEAAKEKIEMDILIMDAPDELRKYIESL